MKNIMVIATLFLLIGCGKPKDECEIIRSRLFQSTGGDNPSQSFHFVFGDKTQIEVSEEVWESHKKGDCYAF